MQASEFRGSHCSGGRAKGISVGIYGRLSVVSETGQPCAHRTRRQTTVPRRRQRLERAAYLPRMPAAGSVGQRPQSLSGPLPAPLPSLRVSQGTAPLFHRWSPQRRH